MDGQHYELLSHSLRPQHCVCEINSVVRGGSLTKAQRAGGTSQAHKRLLGVDRLVVELGRLPKWCAVCVPGAPGSRQSSFEAQPRQACCPL